jgi:hypothetical protein
MLQNGTKVSDWKNGFECEMQETKISRQELSADIAVAEGYESFFSCTRTVKKGRIGYSGEILNHFVLLYFYQISVVDNWVGITNFQRVVCYVIIMSSWYIVVCSAIILRIKG